MWARACRACGRGLYGVLIATQATGTDDDLKPLKPRIVQAIVQQLSVPVAEAEEKTAKRLCQCIDLLYNMVPALLTCPFDLARQVLSTQDIPVRSHSPIAA